MKMKSESATKTRLTLYIPDAMLQCVNDIAAERGQSRLKTMDALLLYGVQCANVQGEILQEGYPKAQCTYCSILCDDNIEKAFKHLVEKHELKKTEVANRLIWYALKNLSDDIICTRCTNQGVKLLSKLE